MGKKKHCLVNEMQKEIFLNLSILMEFAGSYQLYHSSPKFSCKNITYNPIFEI